MDPARSPITGTLPAITLQTAGSKIFLDPFYTSAVHFKMPLHHHMQCFPALPVIDPSRVMHSISLRSGGVCLPQYWIRFVSSHC